MSCPETEAQKSSNDTSCSCKLNLGVEPISSGKDKNSEEDERYKLAEEIVYFQGAGGMTQVCKIKDKIAEVKQTLREYSIDDDNMVIAIPNQISLPDNPRILDADSIDEKDQELDKFYEQKFHQQCIATARELRSFVFLLLGFNASYCLQSKAEKAKKKRSGDQFSELNEHEIDIMKLLEVKDLDEDQLEQCIQLQTQFISEMNETEKEMNNEEVVVSKDRKEEFKRQKSRSKIIVESLLIDNVDNNVCFLFKQIVNNTPNFVKKILDNQEKDFKCFYRYHWYNHITQVDKNEWDSIIILPDKKLVINTEVKRGKSFKLLKCAADQTNKHLKFFKNVFGPLLSDEWNFMKAVCMPDLDISSRDTICNNGDQFILKRTEIPDNIHRIDLADINFKSWFEKCTLFTKTYKEQQFIDEYENLLAGFLGYISIHKPWELNKHIYESTTFNNETQKRLVGHNRAIDGENEEDRQNLRNMAPGALCYRLNPHQLEAFMNPSTAMILDGDFGTGKTYVLKEKAKCTAERYPEFNIAYFTFTAVQHVEYVFYSLKDYLIMDIASIKDFADFENIKVITVEDLGDHFNKKDKISTLRSRFDIYSALASFLQANEFDYIFIDEFPLKYLNERSRNHDYESYDKSVDLFINQRFCITLKCLYTMDDVDTAKEPESNMLDYVEKWKEQLKLNNNAVIINLVYNMRNTQNVMNLSYSIFGDNSALNYMKNIQGPLCYHYKNKDKLKRKDLARAIILKYFKEKPEEPVVFLSYIETDQIFNELKNSFPNRKVMFLSGDERDGIVSNHVNDIMNCPNAILVADPRCFFGSQARNIIAFFDDQTSEYDDKMSRNYLLRATSFAIIIHNRNNITNAQGVVEDINLHTYFGIKTKVVMAVKAFFKTS